MAVKQKAVESLLQGVEDKRAWKEWYRLNACSKHGVEDRPPREVHVPSEEPPPPPARKQVITSATLDKIAERVATRLPPPPQQTQQTQQPQQPQPVAQNVGEQSPVQPEGNRIWPKVALVAATILGSGLAIPAGLAVYNSFQDDPPPIVDPTDPGITLYQDIEEQGLHVPQ